MSKKIVIHFDDEPEMREIVQSTFSNFSDKVKLVSCHNYTMFMEKICLFKKDDPVIGLLDLMLKDSALRDSPEYVKNGIDVAKEVLKERPFIPTILYTGVLTPKNFEESIRAEIKGYLTRDILFKPTDMQEVILNSDIQNRYLSNPFFGGEVSETTYHYVYNEYINKIDLKKHLTKIPYTIFQKMAIGWPRQKIVDEDISPNKDTLNAHLNNIRRILYIIVKEQNIDIPLTGNRIDDNQITRVAFELKEEAVLKIFSRE